VLLFDGPGQGRALIKQGLYMRPDWENVVTPVIDFALTLPEVDAKRIVLLGWSFGGYLAPRAAAGEHRIAALIADPGQWDLGAAFKAALPFPEDQQAKFPNVDPSAVQPVLDQMMQIPRLRWAFEQRGLMVHGVDTVYDYFNVTPAYTVADRAKDISCPTLITKAEHDQVAAYAQTLYDALTCPKTLMEFTAAEGAGGHCEAQARTLYHQRAYDWLDETLAGVPS
jgi:alpha-beta hydrolase superfamily lysophospholipase